jgi:hypothetical protein
MYEKQTTIKERKTTKEGKTNKNKRRNSKGTETSRGRGEEQTRLLSDWTPICEFSRGVPGSLLSESEGWSFIATS